METPLAVLLWLFVGAVGLGLGVTVLVVIAGIVAGVADGVRNARDEQRRKRTHR